MKKRILGGLAVGGLVFGAIFGLAAGLDLSTAALGSDEADVTSCDDAVTTAFGLVGHLVDAVEVGDINEGTCDGATALVELLGAEDTLLDSGTAAITAGAEPSSAASKSIAMIAGTATAADVLKVRVTLNGGLGS